MKIRDLKLDQDNIKYVVGSKLFLLKLKRFMERIDIERFTYCEEKRGTLKRGAYDVLFDADLWEAARLRQEYANILCHTSKLTTRQRGYIVMICNKIYTEAFNRKLIWIFIKNIFVRYRKPVD